MTAAQYNIRDFGATSDTTLLSTQAIQQAIDACNADGGGQVLIPAGLYKTGTIVIKSHVDLHLEHGATLFGSRDLKDYIPLQPEYVSLRTQQPTIQLIYAENATDVSISGQGVIDGQGRGFEKLTWDDEGITRPHLLRFITCNNVVVKGISMRNSGCWMQHYLACENLQIEGLRIFNRNNFNNDAIDIDGCRNVTVSNILADSDDDGITLKSTSPKPCENITITNCVISSRCNAIKLGTETNGGFRNIQISNCVIKPSEYPEPVFFGREKGISALALEIVDGGTLEGVSVSNLVIDGTESPIFIRLANRARTYKQGVVINNIGQLHGVNINNIRIRNAGITGCSITGLPEHPVDDVRISNFVYEQSGGGSISDVANTVEEKEKEYPEATMFGTLPACGFYIRHATNINFDGAQLSTVIPDARPTFLLDDVQGATFRGVQLPGNKQATISKKDCRNIVVKP
jgi:polygalacturonase